MESLSEAGNINAHVPPVTKLQFEQGDLDIVRKIKAAYSDSKDQPFNAAFAYDQSFTSPDVPGKSYDGNLEALTASEVELKDRLTKSIDTLASDIGERNWEKPYKLDETVKFIKDELSSYGYEVKTQPFKVEGLDTEFQNIAAEIKGTKVPEEVIVIGAHYDSTHGSPGANDNGSGLAALLEMARMMKNTHPEKTIRFVAFANEEPPFFGNDDMGSARYAKSCQENGDNIVGMMSLETIGYYSDKPGSQTYAGDLGKLYPNTGDYIGFIGNESSREFIEQAIGSFRVHTKFPSEGAALPNSLSAAGLSDHENFWKYGYSAFMVTDTAMFRYPDYHKPTDTPDKIDYDKMARVVSGLVRTVNELAN